MAVVAPTSAIDGVDLLVCALSTIDQAVLVLDRDRRIVFSNPQLRLMFDLPADLLRPGARTIALNRFLALRGDYGAGDPDVQVEARELMPRTGASFRQEHVRRNGMHVEISGKPVDGGNYVITFMDVTERRTLQLELEDIVRLRTSELERANEELTRLASLDPLLGIANRRAFMEAAVRRWRQVRGSEANLFVFLVDLDRFKAVNDAYGHACGDLVLEHASAAMQTALGPEDLLARYGGEEFVVLLARAEASLARQAADALRTAVAASRVRFEDKEVTVTTSVGMARAEPGEATVALAIARADMAVYAAKDAGRDRVVELL
ncbi:hypothetical protein ASG43_18950 [Aureimonas sp. Leaf454]|uniref:GGDEF domain-containing protein n=1 Tax=Aureimonas sp. Leaf454 TaxID=1736381 RepID=UPI0006FB97D7|nr:diguanylate cyclase [Aureimonas sp. Leaf454]KQT53295.1 hypothetical protein ASG43_18950 [Aureimonas sp. Leaf454]